MVKTAHRSPDRILWCVRFMLLHFSGLVVVMWQLQWDHLLCLMEFFCGSVLCHTLFCGSVCCESLAGVLRGLYISVHLRLSLGWHFFNFPYASFVLFRFLPILIPRFPLFTLFCSFLLVFLLYTFFYHPLCSFLLFSYFFFLFLFSFHVLILSCGLSCTLLSFAHFSFLFFLSVFLLLLPLSLFPSFFC